MFEPVERKGFCRGCVQNIRHRRRFDSGLFRFLDMLTIRISLLIGAGPWKCLYCGTKSLFVAKPIRGIRDYEDDQRNDAEVEQELSQGNYIVRERALIGHEGNTDRFSQKYRDGVVLKVLKGDVTFSAMCSELNVTERELVGWVRGYMDQQQQLLAEEIHQLKDFISQANSETLAIQFRERLDEHKALSTDPPEQHDPGSRPTSEQIIESQSRPVME